MAQALVAIPSDPVRLYPCRWDWCRSSYSSHKALIQHVVDDHISTAKPVKRKDVSLIRRAEEGESGLTDSLFAGIPTQSELQSTMESLPPHPLVRFKLPNPSTPPPQVASQSSPDPFGTPSTPEGRQGGTNGAFTSFAGLSSPSTPDVPSLPPSPALASKVSNAVSSINGGGKRHIDDAESPLYQGNPKRSRSPHYPVCAASSSKLQSPQISMDVDKPPSPSQTQTPSAPLSQPSQSSHHQPSYPTPFPQSASIRTQSWYQTHPSAPSPSLKAPPSSKSAQPPLSPTTEAHYTASPSDSDHRHGHNGGAIHPRGAWPHSHPHHPFNIRSGSFKLSRTSTPEPEKMQSSYLESQPESSLPIHLQLKTQAPYQSQMNTQSSDG
ncbi:hypothetical protein JAAARDRAFT_36515 [Jaapia argillacea MUCL 33604]|uniref:C2H2-type domain-containing protein n=1 Tax=Jaapia argillacea MUCL 33604 TaxID=933084 RepID=A0A067Q173_9AGAM|nr:hypothetical protein JAAARDRAFT_36515 [Jaapia argillacea MUCL 33604]